MLDRCKEPGAPFEPLHLDVLSAMWHSDTAGWAGGERPRVIGGLDFPHEAEAHRRQAQEGV